MPDISSVLFSLKGKKILGINPPVRDFAFFDLWAKPMGLLYILGSLRDLGNEVYLIDCINDAREKPKTYGRWQPRRYEIDKPEPYIDIPRRYWHFGLDHEEFETKLKNTPHPDVVLVTSSMTYWYPGVFWCIERIRRTLPSVPVFLGGPYTILCPDHALRSGADRILDSPMDLPPSMPAMDLYGKIIYGISMTSTGCSRGCSYCASKILWPKFRSREINEVIDEISLQVDLGAEDIAFYDDALLMGKEERFLPLCEVLRIKFPGIRFHTPNGLHVGEINEKCASALFNTGFSTIRLSLEGIDPMIINAGNGKTNPDEYAIAVEHLRNAGYSSKQMETYILVGLPGQKIRDVKKTIHFVESLGGRSKIAQYSPIPGTELFRQILGENPELAKEPLLHNNTVYAPYFSGEISPEEIQSLKDLARSLN